MAADCSERGRFELVVFTVRDYPVALASASLGFPGPGHAVQNAPSSVPNAMPDHTPPSPWIKRFTPLVEPGAAVLDVACGHGRHLRWFASQGHPATGVDRDAAALADAPAGNRLVQADIENGPWPLADERFGAVVVTHYLWRPLLPTILESVAAGGVLLYETFACGQETIGRPKRPQFLLETGELLKLCAAPEWRVVAFEDGFLHGPDRFIQRIAAIRNGASSNPAEPPARYALG